MGPIWASKCCQAPRPGPSSASWDSRALGEADSARQHGDTTLQKPAAGPALQTCPRVSGGGGGPVAEVELRSALGKATESGGKALVPKFPANSGQECERGRKSQEVEALIHHRTSRLITRSGSCENIQLNRNCQTWVCWDTQGRTSSGQAAWRRGKNRADGMRSLGFKPHLHHRLLRVTASVYPSVKCGQCSAPHRSCEDRREASKSPPNSRSLWGCVEGCQVFLPY